MEGVIELKLPIKDMIKLYVKVYKEITGKEPTKVYKEN